jgi:hypothetical protein
MFGVLVVRLTVPGLGAFLAVVSGFLAVAADYIIHVFGLITLLGNMTFLATVATSPATSVWTIFGKVAS